MAESLNDRERFLKIMHYQPVDYRLLYGAGPWPDTLARWRKEGLPADIENVNEYLGIRWVKVINVTGTAGIYPPFPEKVIREEEDAVITIDRFGRTVRNFKDHTSMPEWIDFPVKTAADLKNLLTEHFDTQNLNERYPPEWAQKLQEAQMTEDAVIMVDGGCYYWTLRSLAGVEGASYLLYDAPELVEELFERYFTVVMDGIERLTRLIKVDVIGYGEDVAYKNGPLISPVMFRKMILPRYQKTMEKAHQKGIDLTWYDSDGDLRLFIPDYLSVGINGLAPCEVAAGMDPVALRRSFGKDLRMYGGFDKRIVATGKAAIEAEFARLQPVIEEGGFIPGIDHSVSADISFDNYRFYIDAARRSLGQ